jgi:hypothetical protein
LTPDLDFFVAHSAPLTGLGAMSTKVLRQQSSQDGNHSAVSSIRFRARDLTAQDRDLVPQYR